jgi:hypothetical protein
VAVPPGAKGKSRFWTSRKGKLIYDARRLAYKQIAILFVSSSHAPLHQPLQELTVAVPFTCHFRANYRYSRDRLPSAAL